jgi:hypothetical protein
VEVVRAQAAFVQCSTDLEKHRWGRSGVAAPRWLLGRQRRRSLVRTQPARRLLVTLKETNRAAFIALLQSDLEAML